MYKYSVIFQALDFMSYLLGWYFSTSLISINFEMTTTTTQHIPCNKKAALAMQIRT